MLQAQIIEAGHRAEAESRGMPVKRGDEKNQQMQEKVLDPSSDFPEAPLDSPQQLQQVKDNQGPAGDHQGMQTGDQMIIRPPVAGKSGEQDQRGDMVAGINKGVGDFLGSVGDTKAGRKGTGGVDISNAAGMGGL